MFDAGLTGHTAAVTTLVIIAVMFAMFVRERHPPEVVAVGTAALMLALGLAPYDRAVGVLSNSAPWTIAFMFILMGGLLRTGALNQLSRMVTARAEAAPMLTIAGMFAFVCVASGIMNNTPVVAVMIPIVIQVARKTGIPASRLLMPLSYFTVMGGMITLIGTSTNLLVDGVVRARGMEPFGIFDIAPVGLVVTAVGEGVLLAHLACGGLEGEQGAVEAFIHEAFNVLDEARGGSAGLMVLLVFVAGPEACPPDPDESDHHQDTEDAEQKDQHGVVPGRAHIDLPGLAPLPVHADGAQGAELAQILPGKAKHIPDKQGLAGQKQQALDCLAAHQAAKAHQQKRQAGHPVA